MWFQQFHWMPRVVGATTSSNTAYWQRKKHILIPHLSASNLLAIPNSDTLHCHGLNYHFLDPLMVPAVGFCSSFPKFGREDNVLINHCCHYHTCQHTWDVKIGFLIPKSGIRYLLRISHIIPIPWKEVKNLLVYLLVYYDNMFLTLLWWLISVAVKGAIKVLQPAAPSIMKHMWGLDV